MEIGSLGKSLDWSMDAGAHFNGQRGSNKAENVGGRAFALGSSSRLF